MTQTEGAISIVEGRMTIAGVPGQFVRAADPPLRLEADAFVMVSGHAWQDGVARDGSRLDGRVRPLGATLHRVDSRAALPDLALVVRPFAAEGGRPPMLRLGPDEEEDQALVEPPPVVALFMPQPLFDALRADLAAGRAGRLVLSARTDLWLREGETEPAPGRPLAFHLGLDPQSGRCASAHGRVETLEWAQAPAEPAGPADTGEPVPQLPAVFAQAETRDDEPPEDEVAEALRRINWSLKQLLIVALFLMLIVALK